MIYNIEPDQQDKGWSSKTAIFFQQSKFLEERDPKNSLSKNVLVVYCYIYLHCKERRA